MNVKKLAVTVLLGLGFSMPLMAGDAISQALIAQAKKEIKAVTPQALKKKIDNEDDVIMLDIREPYMRLEGNIEGMENVEIARGLLEFNAGAEMKDKNAYIVVYCRSGKGAVLAAKMMRDDLHYKNVTYLKGGINGWLEAGYGIFNNFGEMRLAE